MKMKEVCTQTGLTERAVRFYVQEKLVVPLAQRRGGRTWLDFAPNHVDRLRAISILRRAGFTLEGIRSMITDFSKNASGAAFALRQRLQAAYDKLRFTDTAQATTVWRITPPCWSGRSRAGPYRSPTGFTEIQTAG